jgi:hypothetical protein
MSLGKKTKTEHGGAKNGGGHWGKREEAKKNSRKLRRRNEKNELKNKLDESPSALKENNW